MMNLNLDNHTTLGRMQIASHLKFSSSEWLYGWFRLDSMGRCVWYKAKRNQKWDFLTDVDQVLDFQTSLDMLDEEQAKINEGLSQ